MLSKSRFVRGLQCHKSLWLYNHRPELREKPSASQQAIFDSGAEVGILAQQLFPGGELIPYTGLTLREQIDQTQKAISAGGSTIYEATFLYDDIFVKVDILQRAVDGWELYEVKSATGCKEVFLNDIAVQFHVVEGSGLFVARAYLVHINNEYVRRGRIKVGQLFSRLDVSHEVHLRQPDIKTEVARQKAMLDSNEPVIDIGPHCEDPYPCDFKSHCWSHVPTPSVFDLADIGKPDPFALYRRRILRLEDIPLEELGWRQQLQVRGTLQHQDQIDQTAVRRFLDGLWYPLCFLDFETTFMTPVPLFDGTRPFEQIPFQFSLHIQDEPEAALRHVAFLAEAGQDPQEAFMQKLSGALPENACILTYNQAFEIGRLKAIARRLPHWQERVTEIIAGIRDLMLPFREKSVYLWPMAGSYSIKRVLPALVPELSYDDLTIGNGEDASMAWLTIYHNPDAPDAADLRGKLLEYCHLDTWGMVRIVDRLRELAWNDIDRSGF